MTRIDKVKATWLKKLMECDFETLGWDARRKRVLIEQDSKCNRCDIDEWQGEKITLEVDHINGDNKDLHQHGEEEINLDLIVNLKFLMKNFFTH